MRDSRGREANDSLEELGLLVDTAGGVVAGHLLQKRESISPRTFLGRGKLEELKGLIGRDSIDVAVFDEDLSPGQVRNLEKELGIKVVDRSEVILHIFALRAKSSEARVQVELAQLEYQLPRLTRLWKHLSRLGGGIGTRGPGETQLEVDRRRVREKIGSLKKQLAGVEKERSVQRKKRENAFRVAIVGYTNAGKSTLFRVLTETEVFVEDRLFATVDATTRRLGSIRAPSTVITDTVGFIKKLPHHLVTSFHATLEEVVQADLLLHVVDSSSSRAAQQAATVEDVLVTMQAGGKPVIIVLNKIDLAEEEALQSLRYQFPSAVEISALKRVNIDALTERILEAVRQRRVLVTVEIPLSEKRLLSHLRESCEFVEERTLTDRVSIQCWAGSDEVGRLSRRGFPVRFG
ncbi:MAG: GTPase HflX [Candidatus Eiseniibacteriota bacterium]|nr:MAG: GTPase HflX [Candidatus Eisenbacteria bacterium]